MGHLENYKQLLEIKNTVGEFLKAIDKKGFNTSAEIVQKIEQE